MTLIQLHCARECGSPTDVTGLTEEPAALWNADGAARSWGNRSRDRSADTIEALTARSCHDPTDMQEDALSAHELYSDVPRGQTLATYDTYAEAQKAVDFLSDEGFPVQHVFIVGSDLRMVENVMGRLTRSRAAAAGAASGAWFGLFVGFLLMLFAPEGQGAWGLLAAGMLYGLVFGAIFGFTSHAITGGKRDFTSRSKIVSSRYEISCAWAEADRGREVLARMTTTP